MKLSEFAALVARHAERNGDNEVVIMRKDPSIGRRANTTVRAAGPGIDWEKGLFCIYPADDLHLHADITVIDALRKQVDGLVWENISLKRENKKLKQEDARGHNQ